MKKVLEKFTTKKSRAVEIIEPTIELLDEILFSANKLVCEDTFLSFDPSKEITRPDEEIWLNNQISAIKNGSVLIYWAVYDSKIVGSVGIYRGKSVRDWHIGGMGLMVDADFRGEGLGQFLLEFTLNKARDVKIRTAILNVFSDNEAAIGLYEKVGFVQYGLLPDGFYRKKHFSDNILMYKQLLD